METLKHLNFCQDIKKLIANELYRSKFNTVLNEMTSTILHEDDEDFRQYWIRIHRIIKKIGTSKMIYEYEESEFYDDDLERRVYDFEIYMRYQVKGYTKPNLYDRCIYTSVNMANSFDRYDIFKVQKRNSAEINRDNFYFQQENRNDAYKSFYELIKTLN